MIDINFVKGNICKSKAEAIVSASNTELLALGGVAKAIFDAAGFKEMQEACSKIGFCDVGDAKITSGFKLKSRYVIHTVGPKYYEEKDSDYLLRKCYLRCLEVAEENGIGSIAFPAISTGTFKFPLRKAVQIAIDAILDYNYLKKQSSVIKACYFYCFNDQTYDAYQESFNYHTKINNLVSNILDVEILDEINKKALPKIVDSLNFNSEDKLELMRMKVSGNYLISNMCVDSISQSGLLNNTIVPCYNEIIKELKNVKFDEKCNSDACSSPLIYLSESITQNGIPMYSFHAKNGDSLKGPAITFNRRDNIASIGSLGHTGNYNFQIEILNTKGTSYVIKNLNSAGIPYGPIIKRDEDHITFANTYPTKNGINGMVYTFAKGKNVMVSNYENGECKEIKYLDYIINEDFLIDLPLKYAFEDYVLSREKDELEKGCNVIEYCSGEFNNLITHLASKVYSDGSIDIGQFSNGKFNGLVLNKSGDHNIYVCLYNYKDGINTKDFTILFSTKYKGFCLRKKIGDDLYRDLIFAKQDDVLTMSTKISNEDGKAKDGLYNFPTDFSSIVSVENIPVNTNINVCSAEENKNKSSISKSEEELDKLIGLASVKKQIRRLKAIVHKLKGTPNKLNLNMCFTGNPGTGKTVVARLIGQILKEEGILPNGEVHEVDRSDLIGVYLGQTAPKVKEAVKNALGGVLFIDEAYSIKAADDDQYGDEAIATLLKCMEDYRGQFAVILAGYKKEMEYMIASNPGFKSRINRFIDFPDYSIDELKEIAKIILNQENYQMADDALDELIKIVESRSNCYDFANAREVRNVIEAVIEIQAERTYDDDDDFLIILEDLLIYESENGISFEVEQEEKHEFNITEKEFKDISFANSETEFKFSTSYIEQATVYIKAGTKEEVLSEGSGFIVSPKGIIVTCSHVVKDCTIFRVTTNFFTTTGQRITKSYWAELIGLDETADIAIIGILNPDVDFICYPLLAKDDVLPDLTSEVVMGGYPFGGSRFESITITEGKIQSINKDKYSKGKHKDIENIYVDLSGQPGNSGSGVIDKKTGYCIGIFQGAAVSRHNDAVLTMNCAVPVKYLWKLIDDIEKNNKG